ncbi:MAG: hypothetical protein AAF957_15995 [Planctomycetota bacterium]
MTDSPPGPTDARAPSPARRTRIAVLVGLGGALLTAALFAALASRHAFIGDDAFISFRYAENLIAGHGLVFNPGERVEGYTNFLWTVLIAAVMAVGLPPEPLSNALGIAAGAVLLALVARMGARERGWGDPLVWLAPLGLAANRTFAAWSTGGLETMLFALLLFAGLARFLEERERDAARPLVSAVLLAAATLTRPEGGLAFVLAAAFFAIETLRSRPRALRPVLTWGLTYGAIVGAHLAFRIAYYGDFVPNTFRAKVTGLQWDQAATWFGMYVSDYGAWAYAWLALVPIVVRRDARSTLFTVFLLTYLAYLGSVGGDIFEFRFLAPLLPFFYWLVQDGVRALLDAVARTGVPGAARAILGAALGATLLGLTVQPSLDVEPWRKEGIASIEAVASYAAMRSNEGKIFRDLVEEGLLDGDELIAVGGAGALPYYAKLPTLDFRGLNDRKIARQAAEGTALGHEKRASMEYLRERRVVIYDVLNRIVYDRTSPVLGVKTLDRPPFRGRLHCVESRGRFLVFATTLSRNDFQREFERFRILY